MKSPADPFLPGDKALACVHCGLCLSACPTYLESGNENDSPRGRIHLMRALEAGRIALDHRVVRHLDLCLGCRACETACPSGVPYGTLIEAGREHVERHYRRPAGERLLREWAIRRVLPYPSRFRRALALANVARATGLHRLLPARFRAVLDLLPARRDPGTRRAADGRSTAIRLASPRSSRPRAAMLTGCVMSVLFDGTHASTRRLLETAGYEVVVPEGQACCGALFAHGGDPEAARAFARRNLDAFAEADVIVSNAAGCGSLMKEYPALLEEERRVDATSFARRVRDLSEVLAESPEFLARIGGSRPPDEAGRVTFHDACHLAHAQRIVEAPRRLVRAAAGEAFIELPEADVCCGSAGSYNLTEPEMARRLQERKVRNVAGLGPVTVVTTNPGCILQIEAGLRAAGLAHARVEHLADWLARRIGV